jgi:cell division protein FtsQ
MARSLAAPAPSRRIPRGSTRSGSGVLRPLSGAAGLLRAGVAFALARRRLRIALLAAVIALPLLGGGWLWLRQSSFVSVRQVQIAGVHGTDAQAVDAALTQAAHSMSTLDVNVGALRAAVAPLYVVRAVRAIARFPHALRIEVSEQLPVAILTVAAVKTAVAADGVVLGPALVSGSLPSVGGSIVPAPGHRVGGASLLGALAVLGAAPAPLAKHVERVFEGAKGLTVAMRNGLIVYFGNAGQPRAKWLSLARVLADSSSAGASYIDVRLPARPAAGFPAGVTPPDASAAATATEPAGSTESTVASLAAVLAGETNTGTSSSTASEPAGASASSGSSTEPAASEQPGEATSQAPTEAAPGTSTTGG